MKQLLIDNIILIFILLFLAIGFFRGKDSGLVKKVLSFFIIIIDIVITKYITPYVVTMIKDITNIESTITDIIFEVFNKTPLFDAKINIEALDKIKNTRELLENMRNTIALGIADVIINVVTSIVVFFVVLIILKLILKLLDIIDYIPVVGSINKILGGVFGLLESLLIIYLIFAIIKAFDNAIPSVHDLVISINKNTFVKYLYDHNYVFNFFSRLFTTIKK